MIAVAEDHAASARRIVRRLIKDEKISATVVEKRAPRRESLVG
jgi:hypothetical protein